MSDADATRNEEEVTFSFASQYVPLIFGAIAALVLAGVALDGGGKIINIFNLSHTSDVRVALTN